MIDINGVRLQNFLELVDESLPRCFNSKYFIYLLDIVTISSATIDFVVTQTLSEIAASGLEDDLFVPLFVDFTQLLPILRAKHHLLSCFHRFQPLYPRYEYILYLRLATSKIFVYRMIITVSRRPHLLNQTIQAPQDYLRVISTQTLFLSNLELTLVYTIQLLVYLPQNLRGELLLLEGKTQDPRGLRAAFVVVGVGCLDVTVFRERIIVYSRLGEVVSDVTLREIERDELSQQLRDNLAISISLQDLLLEEYGHHGSLYILGSIQQLPQTRNTQSHIPFRHTSQMEGIERHLRGRLTYTLRSY